MAVLQYAPTFVIPAPTFVILMKMRIHLTLSSLKNNRDRMSYGQLNPIRAGLTKNLNEYTCSSLLDYLGKRKTELNKFDTRREIFYYILS